MLDHFDSKNDYRLYVCRNVRPCCHHQANEKANEALANEEYNHLHDTLANYVQLEASTNTLHIALNELGDVKLCASKKSFCIS